MKTNELVIKTVQLFDLENAAVQLVSFFEEYKIILFNAPMGAGKTTLIKQLCKVLGSKDHFSSPTYSLVNEYSFPGGKIFHFDLYRLNDVEELMDIGIEDYLDANQYCFVEWPEKMIDLIRNNYVKIEIILEKNIRYIRATKIEA